MDATKVEPVLARDAGETEVSGEDVMEKVAGLERRVQEMRSGARPFMRERKPISEFKIIQNVAPLTEDKNKFREWNNKFISAIGQVDPLYNKAIKKIMHWADAEASPDLEAGWPQKGGVAGIGDIEGLNIEMDLHKVVASQSFASVKEVPAVNRTKTIQLRRAHVFPH